jgi:serine/threonine protein kinase
MENYIKGGKLGEGAWGVVTEAIQKSTNRKVAIKRIRFVLRSSIVDIA